MFKNVSTLECREKISIEGLSDAIFLSKPCFKDIGVYGEREFLPLLILQFFNMVVVISNHKIVFVATS